MHRALLLFLCSTLVWGACSAKAADTATPEMSAIPKWKQELKAGDVAFTTGKYEEAERQWRHALEHEDIPTENRIDALVDLGTLFGLIGLYEKEIDVLLQELHLRRKLHPKGDGEIARILLTLGDAYRSLGDTDEAEAFFQQSILLREELFGPHSLQLARALVATAKNLLEQRGHGRDLRARAMLKRNLKITKKHFGSDHRRVIGALQQLAEAHNSEDGERYFREAVRVARRVFSTQSIEKADAIYHLARNLWNQKEVKEAERLFSEALHIYMKREGKHSANLGEVLNALGNLASLRQAFDEAQQYHIRALKVRRENLEADDPRIAQSLFGIAGIHVKKEDYGAAEPLYRECIAIWTSVYGEEHPFVLATVMDYASVLRKLHREDEAKEVEKRLKKYSAQQIEDAGSY